MNSFTGLFLLVAAFALVGCEKKVEAPAVVDAAVVEAVDAGVATPVCCEADASAPVAPLTAPTAVPAEAVNTATAPVVVPAANFKK